MSYNIPYLFITFDKNNRNDKLEINKELLFNKPGFNISINSSCFEYYSENNEIYEIIIIGAPVYKDKINFPQIAKNLLNSKNIHKDVASINGQFLIIIRDKKENKLKIINDRFNGIHLYWADFNDHFVASFLYFDLFKYLRKKINFSIKGRSMLEFIWMIRVMGEKTYDNFSKYLLPASILEIGKLNPSIIKYWRPDFTKEKRTINKLGSKYIDLLKTSLKRQTSDYKEKKFGCYFSSGLDSRTVVAAAPTYINKLTSYTVSFNDNLEVKYAREAAEEAGSVHRFIKIDNDHLAKNLEANIRICGGMYSVNDTLFTGLKKNINQISDVVFNGHALDFWHYGNYLPSYFVKIFGSKTFLRKLMKINNIVDLYYLYNPFRLTWTNKILKLEDIILPKYSDESIKLIKEAIYNDCKQGDDCCKTKIDQWEYITLHANGRLFSNVNITSMLSTAKVRTPAFDNDIMDFQLSIPGEIKITDKIRNYALNNIGPKIGSIPTANHGFNAGYSSLYKTFLLAIRKIKRILSGNKKLMSPNSEERTYPELNNYLRNNQYLLNEIENAFQNNELRESLYMLNWEKLKLIYEEWLNGKKFDPIFWFTLITLSRFLEDTKK